MNSRLTKIVQQNILWSAITPNIPDLRMGAAVNVERLGEGLHVGSAAVVEAGSFLASPRHTGTHEGRDSHPHLADVGCLVVVRVIKGNVASPETTLAEKSLSFGSRVCLVNSKSTVQGVRLLITPQHRTNLGGERRSRWREEGNL